MLDELSKQFAAFVSLAGVFVAALIGMFARGVHTERQFRRRMFWVNLPFAMLCALIAGAIGDYFEVALTVRYGLAGGIAFLGQEWLRSALRERLSPAKEGSSDAENPEKGA